jgi:hypothetical protein
MRTARSITSGENFGDFLMTAPFSIEGASSKSGAVQFTLHAAAVSHGQQWQDVRYPLGGAWGDAALIHLAGWK